MRTRHELSALAICFFLLTACATSKSTTTLDPISTSHIAVVTTTPQVIEIPATTETTTLRLSPTSEPNVGGISFVDSGQSLGPAHSWDVSLGDLDGDGDLDAFEALAYGGPHEVWLNDGAGSFGQSWSVSAPLAHGVSLGDVDGDGDLDAAMAHGSPAGGHATVWLNDGEGSFADGQLKLGGSFSSAIGLGDLDLTVTWTYSPPIHDRTIKAVANQIGCG